MMLCRHAKDVELPSIGRHHDGPVYLILDSTGLKIYGAGEWCSRKHRTAGERCGWRERHIGVDGDGYVVAEVLTENTVDAAGSVPTLLGQVDPLLRRFTEARLGCLVLNKMFELGKAKSCAVRG